MAETISTYFQHPARVIIAGPSNSGKTTLLCNILKRQTAFFKHPVTKAYWYYGVKQPALETLHDLGVVTREGLPNDIEEDFPTACPANETYIIVLDDLMEEALKDPTILAIFTKWSHHKNITVFLMTQNIYHRGSNSVTIARNVSVAIFIVELRNYKVIRYFLSTSYEKHQVDAIMKWLRQAVENKPYSNFLIDFSPTTNDKYRLRLNIVPTGSSFTKVFIPPP